MYVSETHRGQDNDNIEPDHGPHARQPVFGMNRLVADLGRIGHVGEDALFADLEFLRSSRRTARAAKDLATGEAIGRRHLDRDRVGLQRHVLLAVDVEVSAREGRELVNVVRQRPKRVGKAACLALGLLRGVIGLKMFGHGGDASQVGGKDAVHRTGAAERKRQCDRVAHAGSASGSGGPTTRSKRPMAPR